MENKINIAELLKDCPSGMELDCTLFDDVHFDSIDKVCDIINCYIKDSHHKIGISFNKYGHYSNICKAKCVIFPKGKTTWEGFVPPCQFKEGDIVVSSLGHIHILKNRSTSYIYVDFVHNANGSLCKSLTTCVRVVRLATEEEKARLFNAIKANGYKWNAETKTLEKLIEPKFKVGDVIQDIDINTYKVKITAVNIEEECYEYESLIAKGIGIIMFSKQDEWELVPNKFDITTLKPFDKVLVRDNDESVWFPGLYGNIRIMGGKTYYMTVNGHYKQCIPYKGNENLLGETMKCIEYYKTW